MTLSYRFWMPKFGHVGPYSEQVKRDHDGKIVDIIPKGNPMEDAVNSGQIPSRIQIKLPWSKADKHAKGITKGYIFPRISKDNRRALPSKRSVASYRTIFSKMTKALFEKPYTTHSIRRSAARWAARCGADDSTIKRTGRWKSSSFELYTQDARAEMITELHDDNPSQDHLLWMFKPLR
ncbi:uncharacterized protein LOC116614190 isoform X2 [Nematostella vectensis]|uniref:uncharacterized protein LOC116614190 isoform X2 n=1 Tax=Nematostella vectensis TaxID=45351 RepID=UPI002076F521|nr:uncharacterized protein LOC116614190 isoform X2 [Nematostella vectensis]